MTIVEGSAKCMRVARSSVVAAAPEKKALLFEGTLIIRRFFPCNHRIVTLRLKKVQFFPKSVTCYACATPPLLSQNG